MTQSVHAIDFGDKHAASASTDEKAGFARRQPSLYRRAAHNSWRRQTTNALSLYLALKPDLLQRDATSYGR